MQIDTKAYTRAEFLAHVNGLAFDDFSIVTKKPLGITLHNTWRPLISHWSETDPGRSNALNSLKSYYEGMGWHAGPHAFIGYDLISGFSPLNLWGIHSTCFNHTHIGLEMVGDYEVGGEPFNDGLGAKVRDNAAYAIAVLMRKLDLTPEANLVFHRDCGADHHACPGAQVSKSDMAQRIRAEMTTLLGPAPPPQPTDTTYTVVSGDDLFAIGKRFGRTMTELSALNSIPPPYVIKVGQVLNIGV
jgi:LysM repeat protein